VVDSGRAAACHATVVPLNGGEAMGWKFV